MRRYQIPKSLFLGCACGGRGTVKKVESFKSKFKSKKSGVSQDLGISNQKDLKIKEMSAVRHVCFDCQTTPKTFIGRGCASFGLW